MTDNPDPFAEACEAIRKLTEAIRTAARQVLRVVVDALAPLMPGIRRLLFVTAPLYSATRYWQRARAVRPAFISRKGAGT